MGQSEVSLYPLLLISVLALAVPIVLHRIRRVHIPVVVGEIICGIIIGRSGLDIITPNQWLDFLSLIGFTYLMFLGGMEIDFSMVLGRGRRLTENEPRDAFSPMTQAVLIFAGTLALSFALALFLKQAHLVAGRTSCIILALLLGTTSVGVILPVLKESGALCKPYGQTLLLAATVADLVTITMATLAVILLGRNPGNFKMAAMAALGLAFYLVYSAGAKMVSIPIIRRVYMELSHTSAQLRVRTAFAFMLLFTVLSQVVGVEVILGAFIAGAIFSSLFESETWEDEVKFDAIGYGFFIPVFFIMVGVRLDLSQIWHARHAGLLIAVMIVGAFAVKMIPALVMAVRYGWRRAIVGGMLLSGRLSLFIAFAEVAVKAGLLSPAMQTISILIAVITCLVAPVAFMREKFDGGEAMPRVGILILGAGKVGRLLARRFHERGHSVSLIDIDSDAAAKASREGLNSFHFTHIDEQTLKRAGACSSHTFVAVTNDDKANLDACLAARNQFDIKSLVSRVGNPANIKSFIRHGIRPMNTTLASVVTLENLIYRPNVFNVLSHADGENEVLEVVITNPGVAGRRISEMRIPEDALILMVRKGEITSVPHGNTRLELGDIITLFVRTESLNVIARLFDPERPDHHIRSEDKML